MAEKRQLLKSGSIEDHVGYGSISRSGLHQNDDEVVPVRFLYRKSDCIVVSVLFVLAAVAIITTLSIGIPLIRAKNVFQQLQLELNPNESIPVNPLLKMSLGGNRGMVQAVPPAAASGQAQSNSGIYASAAVSSNCPECSAIAS